MHWFDRCLGRFLRSSAAAVADACLPNTVPALEILEDRTLLTATGSLAGCLALSPIHERGTQEQHDNYMSPRRPRPAR